MRVNVEGNLYILSDEKQFILSQEKTRKVKDKETGEEREEQYMDHLGYYSSLQGAVKAIITRKMKESTATDLKSLLTALEHIKVVIESKIAV